MLTKELYFDLPEASIAQYPSDKRGEDKLLLINRTTGEYEDHLFSDIVTLLPPDSLLILNDTRVRKARVFGLSCPKNKNDERSKVEFLFLNPNSDGTWNCIVNRFKRRKIGEVFEVFHNCKEKDSAGEKTFLTIVEKGSDGIATVQPSVPLDENFFLDLGHVPLPPYIKREDVFSDESRYQTVYSRALGSVASPTAGLHWTEELLRQVQARGIQLAYITLHVGMGTFVPVREEKLEDHKMHREYFEINKKNADIINEAVAKGKRIIVNGTTTLRCVESAFDEKTRTIPSLSSSTNIFITPGYKFKLAQALITNFHTPESTLLALVAAFSSLDIVKCAYGHAIEAGYKFFSYGDACLFV